MLKFCHNGNVVKSARVCLFWLVAILFLIIISNITCSKNDHKNSQDYIEAIYDGSHNNAWYIKDTGFFGYSEFANTLRSKNILVSVCESNFLTTINNQHGKNAVSTMLIINAGKQQKYLSDEINSIKKFVKNGGRLFVIGEHDNMFGSSEFHNSLLKNFGIRFNYDSVGNPEANERQTESTVFQLENIYDQLSCSIGIISKPSKYKILLEGFALYNQRKIICAGFDYGRGRVVVLGDSEMFWNGNNKIGMFRGDNKKFLESIIDYMFENKSVIPKMYNRINSSSSKIIYIDISNGELPLDYLNGIRKFCDDLFSNGFSLIFSNDQPYDVRLIASPRKMITPSGDEKLVIFADGYSQLNDRFTTHKLIPIDSEYSLDSIYHNISDIYNIDISPGFVARRDGIIAYPYINTACIVKNPKFKYMDFDEDFYGEILHPGTSFNEKWITEKNSYEDTNVVFSESSSKIIIFADSDWISNANHGAFTYSKVLVELLAWLKSQ